MVLPGVGYFIKQNAGPLVNRTIQDWLTERQTEGPY